MFQNIKKTLSLLALPAVLFVGALALVSAPSVFACTTTTATGVVIGTGQPCASGTQPFDPAGNVSATTTALDSGTIQNTIINIANILGVICVGIAVIFVVYGAFQWITGNEKEGRATVQNAVIGLFIVLGAYLIVQLGINIYKNFIEVNLNK